MRLKRLKRKAGCRAAGIDEGRTAAFGVPPELVAGRANGQTGREASGQALGLPTLNTVRVANLHPAYSCQSAEQVSQGYGSTALFLSSYSMNRNSPELLFNGACGAENYFEVNMAGDQMSLIADLGEAPLPEITAQIVFNYRGVHDSPAYTRFASAAKIEPRHTCAVLINRSDCRGLLVFTVDAFTPDREVRISYAVKDYQVRSGTVRSPGFGWSTAQDR
jgi:hypothetical protein